MKTAAWPAIRSMTPIFQLKHCHLRQGTYSHTFIHFNKPWDVFYVLISTPGTGDLMMSQNRRGVYLPKGEKNTVPINTMIKSPLAGWSQGSEKRPVLLGDRKGTSRIEATVVG